MTPPNLEKGIRRLIADIVELPEEKITPEALFIENLDMISNVA